MRSFSDNGERAVELLNESSFDLVITDLVMTPIDGMEVLKKSKYQLHPVKERLS